MQTLSQFSNIENMRKVTILLRSTIENAINKNISKRRSCNQLKVWWSKVLIDKRKTMIYWKRQWKNFKIQSGWDLFKRSRDNYYYELEKQKINHERILWTTRREKKYFKHTNIQNLEVLKNYHLFHIMMK